MARGGYPRSATRLRRRPRRRGRGERAMATADTTTRIEELLGEDADSLLNHRSETVPASQLHLPGPDMVDRVHALTDRNNRVLRNLQWLYDSGRTGGTGYLSILPVDQGIEHSAGASFAPNPAYFDPENLVRLAVEGGCSAFASTFGVLGSVSRRWAHRIPFIVKLNHNELLTYPNEYDQVMFGTVQRAWELGRRASGRRSTSARTTAAGRSSRSPAPSRRPTAWACSPCSGATCATLSSSSTASTTTWPPTSRARPTTWA